MCSFKVYTGPGEFVRPDCQRSQHLRKVAQSAWNHDAHLAHAATRSTAAQSSYERRWAIMFKKYVAAAWPGAHDVVQWPTLDADYY